MTAENNMPIGWQIKHTRATVTAGAELFAAQSPFVFATGRNVETVQDAESIANSMDKLFWNCPRHQWGVAAQAMNNMGV